MRRIDRAAIQRYRIPSLLLMENAGRVCAEELYAASTPAARRSPRCVTVFCGAGNNGGDGFAAARHLALRGVRTRCFVFIPEWNLKPDPRAHFVILRKMKVPLIGLPLRGVDVKRCIETSDWIIDAIFGTGLSRPVGEPFYSVIERLNALETPVLSVDIPSGLCADTGRPLGIAVKAKVTVTFGLPKRGFFAPAAHRYTGRVIVRNIGFPPEILK